MSEPKRVYCASKLFRAKLWRDWKSALRASDFEFVSTWHDSESVERDEADNVKCHEGWQRNLYQILKCADHMIVFANDGDRLNGTLVEIGLALSCHIDIHIVGSYQWGTWHTLDNVYTHRTLHQAFDTVYSESLHLPLPINKELLHDPS